MKIYISGPITGVDGYLERFDLAENALVAAVSKAAGADTEQQLLAPTI